MIDASDMSIVYKRLYIISKRIEGSTGFYRVGKRQREQMSFVKLI